LISETKKSLIVDDELQIIRVMRRILAEARWQIILYGSIINRFLSEVKDAAVHVIPIEKEN